MMKSNATNINFPVILHSKLEHNKANINANDAWIGKESSINYVTYLFLFIYIYEHETYIHRLNLYIYI